MRNIHEQYKTISVKMVELADTPLRMCDDGGSLTKSVGGGGREIENQRGALSGYRVIYISGETKVWGGGGGGGEIENQRGALSGYRVIYISGETKVWGGGGGEIENQRGALSGYRVIYISGETKVWGGGGGGRDREPERCTIWLPSYLHLWRNKSVGGGGG